MCISGWFLWLSILIWNGMDASSPMLWLWYWVWYWSFMRDQHHHVCHLLIYQRTSHWNKRYFKADVSVVFVFCIGSFIDREINTEPHDYQKEHKHWIQNIEMRTVVATLWYTRPCTMCFDNSLPLIMLLIINLLNHWWFVSPTYAFVTKLNSKGKTLQVVKWRSCIRHKA